MVKGEFTYVLQKIPLSGGQRPTLLFSDFQTLFHFVPQFLQKGCPRLADIAVRLAANGGDFSAAIPPDGLIVKDLFMIFLHLGDQP